MPTARAADATKSSSFELWTWIHSVLQRLAWWRSKSSHPVQDDVGLAVACCAAAPVAVVDTGTPEMIEKTLGVTAEEFELVYIPFMRAVYTSRHKMLPPSEAFLRDHVFGSDRQPGCEECRAETELLVSHQEEFV